MHEFEIINKYFSKLTLDNKSSLNLNDDVFFDKSKKLVISVDTYIEGIHFINFEKTKICHEKDYKIINFRFNMQRCRS